MSVWVLVLQSENASPLVQWAALFARARKTSLHVVIAERGEPRQRVYDRAEDAKGASHPMMADILDALPAVDPVDTSIELFRDLNLVDTLLPKVAEAKLDLFVLTKPLDLRSDHQLARVVSSLFRLSACRTLLLRLAEESHPGAGRMLVPASGGPHSKEALVLGRQLVEHCEFTLTPLYIEQVQGDVAEDVGRTILVRLLDRAGLSKMDGIEPRVVVNVDVQTGIAHAATDGFDLIIIGQSPEGSIRKWLFGTLPGRLVEGADAPAIGVIRCGQPIRARMAERASSFVGELIPQLSREERVTLFERVETQSRWSFDFFALISLATAIASLGLIQNSAAVVIGAMLVAPLMTPILGMGLSLVQGNGYLMRMSTKAVILGFVSALLMGYVVGLVAPPDLLTKELLARGNPTILDFWVALFSGLAAAYCMGRTGLSAALPGVAIAAALVPPIATIGISFSMGAWTNGRNAAILFGTNVVIIILGASLCFFFTCIRAHLGRSYTALFLLFVALAAAIALYLYQI